MEWQSIETAPDDGTEILATDYDPRARPMPELSPAAQAIWEAFNDVAERVGTFEDSGDAMAAALRALADQAVPDGPKPNANSDYHLMNWTKTLDQYDQRQQTRAEILAIAAELEGQPTVKASAVQLRRRSWLGRLVLSPKFAVRVWKLFPQIPLKDRLSITCTHLCRLFS